MNRTLLAIVVAAVIFGTVWMFRGGKEDADTSAAKSMATAVQSARTPSPDVVLAIKPGNRAAVKPATETSKLSSLMKEFTTEPAKPIYDRLSAKSSRTPEENYVLARILENCTDTGRPRPRQFSPGPDESKSFAAAVSDKDPDRAKRIAAFERMNNPSQCAGFEGMKTDPQRIKDLAAEAAAGGDPKARARAVVEQIRPGGVVNGNNMPGISDQQLDTLRDAARSGDPYAILIVGSLLSSTLGDLMIRAGPQERPIDQRAFYDAWTLAACASGLDCGPNNFTVLNGCAHNGNCGAQDLEDYLYFYGNSPQQSQLTNEYRSQLIRAVQSGDWSYFAFVRARPPQGSTFIFGTPRT